MDYRKGYVYALMDQGGPTDTREPYFKEAVEEMMRARTLCAKANATMPDDPAYLLMFFSPFRMFDYDFLCTASHCGLV